jgi:hypothetical protein
MTIPGPIIKSDSLPNAFFEQSVLNMKNNFFVTLFLSGRQRSATLQLLCDYTFIAACVGIFLFRTLFATSVSAPLRGRAPEVAPLLFTSLSQQCFGKKKNTI